MKDYYTTDDITDMIKDLTLALWQYEKRASKEEVTAMNARLMNLRVYEWARADDITMEAKLDVAGI